jgi:hypothetical protein
VAGANLSSEDEALSRDDDTLLRFNFGLDDADLLRGVTSHPHRLASGELQENLCRHRGRGRTLLGSALSQRATGSLALKSAY